MQTRIWKVAARAALRALAASLAVLCAACQSPLPETDPRGDSEALNRELGRVAALVRGTRGGGPTDYRVGPGDLLEIDVFDVEELKRTVRVRPDGTISLPLLGRLTVAGETTSELEGSLERQLGADYLWNPQVSVFVREYRAHAVSVLGEVNEPGVFYLREPRTLVEILSEAGGMTERAGTVVHVRRRVPTPAPGQPTVETIEVALDEHLAEDAGLADLPLADDDVVIVPKGGFVFVKGAVEKPGVYALQGEGSVLKAITMAGGLAFEADRSDVRVIRRRRGSPEILEVDLDAIESQPHQDLVIRDGDVVVVDSHPVRIALNGFWRGISGLFSLSGSAF